jgi:hypothetical protein
VIPCGIVYVIPYGFMSSDFILDFCSPYVHD